MAGELIGGLVGTIVCVCVLLVLGGIGSVDPTHMALKYNWVMKTLDTNIIIDPGMQYVGFQNQLIKYPKTIQTISYNVIDGRTKDGLDIKMTGLSFQYQLQPTELYALYTSYEQEYGDYMEMYKLMGVHLITEMACNYTAYQFFNDKQKIALEMMFQLNQYFTQNLHATIDSLQINDDHLPAVFSEMIIESAAVKQNISKTEKTMGAKIVQMQTAVKVAQAQANVTIQNAIGQSSMIEQNGAADAAVITSFVQSELESYTQIKNTLGLEGDELLKYIWYDAVGGGSVIQPGHDFTVFSGVQPGAYMTEER